MELLVAYKLIGRDDRKVPKTRRHPRHSKTSQESLDPWTYRCAADHAAHCRVNKAYFDGPDWHHCNVCSSHDSSGALKPLFAASISEPDKDTASYCGYKRHRHVAKNDCNPPPDKGSSRDVIQGEVRPCALPPLPVSKRWPQFVTAWLD